VTLSQLYEEMSKPDQLTLFDIIQAYRKILTAASSA